MDDIGVIEEQDLVKDSNVLGIQHWRDTSYP